MGGTRSYDPCSPTPEKTQGGFMSFSSRPGLNTLFSVVGLSLASGGVSAQDAGAESLEEITVTAQRRLERLTDVPVSISAYSQERIDQQGVKSIDDIARLTPGITF